MDRKFRCKQTMHWIAGIALVAIGIPADARWEIQETPDPMTDKLTHSITLESARILRGDSFARANLRVECEDRKPAFVYVFSSWLNFREFFSIKGLLGTNSKPELRYRFDDAEQKAMVVTKDELENRMKANGDPFVSEMLSAKQLRISIPDEKRDVVVEFDLSEGFSEAKRALENCDTEASRAARYQDGNRKALGGTPSQREPVITEKSDPELALLKESNRLLAETIAALRASQKNSTTLPSPSASEKKVGVEKANEAERRHSMNDRNQGSKSAVPIEKEAIRSASSNNIALAELERLRAERKAAIQDAQRLVSGRAYLAENDWYILASRWDGEALQVDEFTLKFDGKRWPLQCRTFLGANKIPLHNGSVLPRTCYGPTSDFPTFSVSGEFPLLKVTAQGRGTSTLYLKPR